MDVYVDKGTLFYHTKVEREKKEEPKRGLARRVLRFFYNLGNAFENPARNMLRNADEPIQVHYIGVSPEKGGQYLEKRLRSQRKKNSIAKYFYGAAAVVLYPVELIIPGPGPSTFFALRAHGSHRASKYHNLETVLDKVKTNYQIDEKYAPNAAYLAYAR